MKDKETNSKLKGILGFFSVMGYILFVGVVIFLCYFIISSKVNNKVPVFGNYSFLKVLTGSMETTISKDQIVLVKKVSVDEIKQSDVISYYCSGKDKKEIVITHRVTKVLKDPNTNAVIGFKTKGDANDYEDPW